MKEKDGIKDFSWTNWWASHHHTQIDLKLIEVDARALLAFLPCAIFPNMYTLYAALSVLLLFILFSYQGLSVSVALKKIKTFFAGRRRTVGMSKRRRRRLIHD